MSIIESVKRGEQAHAFGWVMCWFVKWKCAFHFLETIRPKKQKIHAQLFSKIGCIFAIVVWIHSVHRRTLHVCHAYPILKQFAIRVIS